MLAQTSINNKFKKNFQNPQFNDQASLIKCLGDPTCLKILFILSKERMICPSDLSSILKISMPAISHQLGRLKQMGILENKRMGQSICYSLANSQNAKLIKRVTAQIFKELSH